jgi:hypothetical protein
VTEERKNEEKEKKRTENGRAGGENPSGGNRAIRGRGNESYFPGCAGVI